MTKISEAQILWKALEDAVSISPDKPMYIYQGKEISFEEVDETSDRVAAGLLARGFRKGDRIGIIGLNQPEWLYTYFAAGKIGAVIVGLNVRYRDTELEYILNQSESRGLITLKSYFVMDYVKFFDDFREKIPSVKDFIFIDGEGFPGSITYDELLHAEVDRDALEQAKAAVQPDDPLIIIYTSGTTGKPKGAVITHKSQLASARAQDKHIKLTEDDSLLVVLPFNHVGGITCMILGGLLGRCTGILIPTVDLDDIITQAEKYRPSIFGGVPTLYALLFMNERFPSLDTSSFRLAIAGGSNVEPALLTRMNRDFPNATVMNLYGLSEASGGIVMSPWESSFETTVRSIGKPFNDVELKVVDVTGKTVPAKDTGELCFRGDAVASGYFRLPEETKETFDADGWVHSGDMGYVDEEGYIILMGRKKEMYIRGGFNVYPVEVENLLTKHPKVVMAAGIGVPDSVLGEKGRYYIIPQPGTDLTEEELRAYCKEHLADYKVPDKIVFRESLPMTPVGKIMKSKLKEDYEKAGE